MVAGLEQPTAGRIRSASRDVTGPAPYQRPVNTVFQSYALFPHLTSSRTSRSACAGAAPRTPSARSQEVLELVELGHLARQASRDQLSGGQQQRVALARALVNRPDVLLLDEPLGALDLKLRRQMQIELKRIQTEVGLTFVHVTHDQEEAMTMADTIAVMNGGPDRAARRPGRRSTSTRARRSSPTSSASPTSSGRQVTGAARRRPAARRRTAQRLAGARSRAPVPDGPARCWSASARRSCAPSASRGGPAATGCPASVTDASFIGVATQYLVRMPWGQELTVVQQNDGTPGCARRAGHRALGAGARLRPRRRPGRARRRGDGRPRPWTRPDAP